MGLGPSRPSPHDRADPPGAGCVYSARGRTARQVEEGTHKKKFFF